MCGPHREDCIENAVRNDRAFALKVGYDGMQIHSQGALGVAHLCEAAKVLGVAHAAVDLPIDLRNVCEIVRSV